MTNNETSAADKAPRTFTCSDITPEEMLRRTDTAHAPWHLVPGHDRRQTMAEIYRTLVGAIDRLADARIQAIMVRRYLNNQSFAQIAAEMAYDLRWVYRLHQRGLAAGESG